MAKRYYYLHINGDIIRKPLCVVDCETEYFNSPLVRKYWLIDTDKKDEVIRFISELCNMGANQERILDVARELDLTQYELPNRP